MRKIKQFLLTTAESPQSGRRALSGLFKSKAMKCLLTTLLLLGSTLTSWAVREIYDLPTEQPVLIDESNYQQYGLTSEYIGYRGLSKPQHLYWMTDMGRGRAPINYVLLNDIVMNSGSGTKKRWVPLGGRVYNRVIHSNGTLEVSLNEERAYTGTFDGNGHTISGLYFDNTGSILMITQEESNDYAVSYEFVAGPKVGFIGVANGATIKNLGIINATIINDDNYVGGIVGYCINSSAENYNGPTTITNCWFEGVVRGKNNTGGICGYGGNITKCYNTGTVSGAYYTGGICGYGGNITNCYNTGAVSGSAYTGGICGNGGTQNNCYTTGMVSSSSSYFGGICGSSGTQNNCYYLEGSCSRRGGGVSATADEFASGKIAYLLNGNTFDGTTWRQTLFTDAAPLLATSHKAVTGYINEVDNVITTYGNVALSTDYTVGEGKTLIIPEGATVTTIGSSKIINNGTLIVEGTISGNNLDGNGAFYYAQLDDADVTLNTVSVPYKGSAYTVGDLDVSYASRIYKGKTFTYSNTATMTYQNNTNCGTATVTWNGSVTREFTIAPKAVTTPTVELSATVFTYSGNEQKPTVTLKDGETVIDPSEYTVTYPSDVVNEGDKTITITDNEGGNYIISECSAEYSIVLDPEIVDGFYQIGNAKQLAWFANLVNSGTTNANAVLVSNIVVNSNVLATDGSLNDDGSNFSVWTPIGTSSRKYTGTFNGQGHTISGLYYNNSTASYVGLFGCVDGATITKVGVVDSYLKGNQYVGGICGNGGTIIGCHNASNVSGNSNVGGICGNGGTQTSCYSIGTVSGSAICGNGGTQTLCYYLTGSATSAGGGSNASKIAFTNGEAAYMLNGNTSEGDILWYQDIGADAMPTTNNRHGIVYYSNNLYGNGICPTQIADEAQAEALGLSSSYVGYYAIGSADELYGFSELVKRGTTSANGVLTDDIVVNRNVLNEDGTLNGDGSNFRKWIPIGSAGAQNIFTGNFYGNGHTVSGLYFDDSGANNVGLFGCIKGSRYGDGSIYDVGVVDSYFNGYQNVGGICGYFGSSDGYGGNIFRCYSTSTISGWRNVGGICGYSETENTYITHCYNAGSVSGHYDVGGICGGGSYYGKVTVNYCFNVGNVSATNNYDADGICPHAGTWIKCYSLENSAPTLLSSSTIIASASEFASGKIVYLIGGYFRQTLFSDAYPSFNKNSNWVTGYIDEDGDVLTVVGNPVLTTNYTIAEGKTLVIPEGTSYDDRPSIETTGDAVITNNGTIICNGTIIGNDLAGDGNFIFENLTSNDVILNTTSYPYKGTAYTLEDGLDITISRVMCGKTFTYYNPETPLEVVYYNNVNVGTTASISWIKTFWSEQYSEYNYRQYAYKTFSITPKEVELVWLQSELPYSGEAQAPTVRVIGIYENDEYEITVEGAQSAVGGPYIATATALSNSNYALPENVTTEFSIVSRMVSEPTIVLSANTFTYNGQAQTPTVTVKDGNTTIDPSEYTVTMSDDVTNAGQKTVTISNVSGNYNVSGSATFTINPKEVTNPTIALSATSFTYNGSAIEPTVTVKNGKTIIDPSEYTVSYSNNTNAGTTAKVTITDKADGNYTVSSVSATFTINPKEVTNPTIELSATSFTYNGSAQTPTVTVKVGSTTIPTSEYTVSYPTDVTNAGQKTINISNVNGNYTVSNCSATFTISPKVVSNPTIELSQTSYTYDGSAKTPTVTSVKDGSTIINSDEYTVSYSDNTNAGTATVTITDKANGNYTVSNCSATFTISPKVVSSPTIELSQTSYTYDGSAKTPTVSSVKDGSTTIASGEYTVSYSNNTNAGTATVTIADKANGNYTVSGSTTFTISPKVVTNPTIALSQTSYTYDGSAKTPTVSSVKDGSTTIASGEYTVSYSNNTNAGTATVTIADKANGNYTVSGSATFTISPKEVSSPTIEFSDAEITYTGSALTPTITVKDGSTVIPTSEYTVGYSNNTNAGTANLTITDKANGNYTVSGETTFTINPKTVSNPTITLSQTTFIYDGTAKSPTVTSVKDGSTVIPTSEYTVTMPDDAVSVGDYTVEIEDIDGGNYTVRGTATYVINLCTEHQFDDFGQCTVCGEYTQPELVDGVYQIASAAHLYWFASWVNKGNAEASAVLTADIVVNSQVLAADGSLNGDGSNFRTWTPIGFYDAEERIEYAFSGTFDGNNHTISGLYSVDYKYYVGLFGIVEEATIKNVGIVDSYFSGEAEIGGICGYAKSNSAITNCYNTGAITCGEECAGGICGEAYGNCTITNCYNTGAVDCEIAYAGGICGDAYDNCTITNCHNTATVTCGEDYAGGICGFLDGGSEITNCYNTATVTCGEAGAGGICGVLESGCTIVNCYNTGAVTCGESYAGGICGYIYESTLTNNFYLAGCATVGEGENVVVQNGVGVDEGEEPAADAEGQTTAATASEFASGRIAYLLNGSEFGGSVWHQTLFADEAPVLNAEHNSVAGYIAEEGSVVTVVGSVVVESAYEVANGKTLNIPANATLTTTGDGAITNNGTIVLNGTLAGNDLAGSGNFIYGGQIATADLVLSNANYVYKGSAYDDIEFTVSRTICGKVFTYGDAYTVSYANNINAGQATISLTNSNDAENVVSSHFTIKPIEDEVVVTVTLADKSVVFSGAAQTYNSEDALTIEADNALYNLDWVSASGNAASVSGTNAAEYAFGWNAEMFSNTSDNFTNVRFDVTDGKLIITPNTEVVVTVTENSSTLTYNGEEHSVSGYSVAISDATGVYSEDDFAFSGTATASGINAGVYPMQLSADDFSNTNENFAEVTFNIVDGALTISKAAEAPNKPAAAMETRYINTQLVALPADWAWSENKALELGDNTATANYAGADKGNYVTESVDITITRLECLHNEGNTTLYTLEPTCTHKGYTGNTSCKLCGQIYEMGDSIPALGHDFVETVVAPTCTTDGYTEHLCNRCQHIEYSDTVAATGHKADSVEFENVVAATCTEAGSRDSVVYCSVCQIELSRTKVVIPAGHHIVVDPAVAATTTSTGLTEGSHCDVCHEVLVAQQTIPVINNGSGEENQGGNEGQGEENQGGNEGQGEENQGGNEGQGEENQGGNEGQGEENQGGNEGQGEENQGGNEGQGEENQGGNEGQGEENQGGNEGQGEENQGGNEGQGEENQGGEENTNPGTAVAETAANAVNIYAFGNTIVVENAENDIYVYDAMGRLIVETPHCDVSTEIRINRAGVYIVKTGTTAKRVMIND